MFGHPRNRMAVSFAALLALGAPLAACSDEDGGDAADTSAETNASTAPDDTGGAESVADSDAMRLGTELCEAFGAVHEPGGVDAVLQMLSEDVVFTDVVLGADLTGKAQVEAYLAGDAFAGIDTAQCGAIVARGNWGAGAYTLADSATGAGGSGIAAVHVTDGLVDRQVVHYTQNEADAPPPPVDTITEGVVLDYCHAWDDGADADEVLAHMTEQPTLVLAESITGTEQVRAFVESFEFDENACADEVIVHGDWGAAANTFTNHATGAVVEGVSVVRIDDARIAEHYAYLDPVV